MYCDYCGEPITQGTARCPKCQKPVRPLVQGVGIDVKPPVQTQKAGSEWKRLEKAIISQTRRFNAIVAMLGVIILLCFSQNLLSWFAQHSNNSTVEVLETQSEITEGEPGDEPTIDDTVQDESSFILYQPQDIEFSYVLLSLEVKEPVSGFEWQKYCEETQSWNPVDTEIFDIKINETKTRTDLCLKQVSEEIYGQYRCSITVENKETPQPEPMEASILQPIS